MGSDAWKKVPCCNRQLRATACHRFRPDSHVGHDIQGCRGDRILIQRRHYYMSQRRIFMSPGVSGWCSMEESTDWVTVENLTGRKVAVKVGGTPVALDPEQELQVRIKE